MTVGLPSSEIHARRRVTVKIGDGDLALTGHLNPLPPAAIKRVSLAVAYGALSPTYGTPVGLLRLAGILDKRQYAAAMAFRDAWEALEAAKGIRYVQSPRYGESAPRRSETRADAAKVDYWQREYNGAVLAAIGAGRENYEVFWRIVLLDHDCNGAQQWRVRRVAEALADRASLASRHRRANR